MLELGYGSHPGAPGGDLQLSALLLGGNRQWWPVDDWWAVHPHGENFCPVRVRVTAVPIDKEKGVQRREERKLHNGCSYSWSKVREQKCK